MYFTNGGLITTGTNVGSMSEIRMVFLKPQKINGGIVKSFSTDSIGDLTAYLKKIGFDWEKITYSKWEYLGITKQICGAFHGNYQIGIVHRNVIISNRNQTKLDVFA